MPTMAPAPPAAREKNVGDQFCSSPTSRSSVTARVITAGVTISDLMEGLSVVMSPLLVRSLADELHGHQELGQPGIGRRVGGHVHVGAAVRAVEDEALHVEVDGARFRRGAA